MRHMHRLTKVTTEPGKLFSSEQAALDDLSSGLYDHFVVMEDSHYAVQDIISLETCGFKNMWIAAAYVRCVYAGPADER